MAPLSTQGIEATPEGEFPLVAHALCSMARVAVRHAGMSPEMRMRTLCTETEGYLNEAMGYLSHLLRPPEVEASMFNARRIHLAVEGTRTPLERAYALTLGASPAVRRTRLRASRGDREGGHAEPLIAEATARLERLLGEVRAAQVEERLRSSGRLEHEAQVTLVAPLFAELDGALGVKEVEPGLTRLT